jgi:hypothetical protein
MAEWMMILNTYLVFYFNFYSYLNASTGFLVAAFQLCQLTVSKAIPKASIPARAKIH